MESSLFKKPNKRSELSGNIFSVLAARFWNDLNVHVKDVNLCTFKKILDNCIKTLAYYSEPLLYPYLGS